MALLVMLLSACVVCRWVVYNTKDIQMDYDPAAVPAQWHGWLHHSTDSVPTDLESKVA